MASFDSTAPIALRWTPAFQPILDELERRIRANARYRPYLVTRALLTLLRDNDTTVSGRDVVRSVHEIDLGLSTQVTPDWEGWLGYIPRVVAALRSHNPESVLALR